MTATAQKSPQEIVDLVRQSTCTFPAIFSAWPGHPPRCSPYVEALIKDADDWIDASFDPGRRRSAYKASQFGLLAAYAHPDAPYKRARVLAWWYAFIFTFDDPLDQPHMVFGADRTRFDQYVGESKRWVACTLGLAADDADAQRTPTPEFKVIANFRPIGEALRQAWTRTQRERFLRYFLGYLDGCTGEAASRVDQRERLPTVEEFWRVRLGTAAIWPCAVMFQYEVEDEDGGELPDELWDDGDLQEIVRGTTYDTAGRNEGISLRNELDDEAWHNLVLVMLYHGHASSLREAIEKLGVWLEDRLAEREACAARLLERWGTAMKTQLEKYVECHRRFSVTLRKWDFVTNRYGFEEEEVRPDGTFEVDFARPGKASRR